MPLVLDQEYVNLKNQIIKAERRVLKELGFCVHVKHPHKIIVMYLQVLECERNQHLVQTAWVASEDSLLKWDSLDLETFFDKPEKRIPLGVGLLCMMCPCIRTAPKGLSLSQVDSLTGAAAHSSGEGQGHKCCLKKRNTGGQLFLQLRGFLLSLLI